MTHTLTWYGHSNFKIETGGKALFIDPFFEGNPTAPTSWQDAGTADLVLLTHDHDDHMGQALDICKAHKAPLVAMYDIIRVAFSQGLPEELGIGFNIGGTIEQFGIKIKMVQAVHSSPTGAPAGFILTFPDGFCLYHAGDTALFATMELFAKFHAIDLSLLPIGGWFTMDPQAAAYACKLLKTKRVTPMHWGTFPILEQNLTTFEKELEHLAPDTSLLKMEPGKPVKIQKSGPDLNCGCE